MALALEAELEAVVDQSFAIHALREVQLAQQVDRALLQDTGADARLDVRARAMFEDDGFDPLGCQEVRKHETGRTCANDGDLRARVSQA